METSAIDISQILVTLISTIGAIVSARMGKKVESAPPSTEKPIKKPLNKWALAMWVSIIVAVVNTGVLGWRLLSPTPVFTTSEEFVTAAWNAFNDNRFTEAINFAQETIGRWESEAIKQQAALSQEPPNGKVTEDERKAIFANWALNDVATAYFIKARSLEKLGKIAGAKEAYWKIVTTFPYARCWDPEGWFWSPAEEAKNRLTKMP